MSSWDMFADSDSVWPTTPQADEGVDDTSKIETSLEEDEEGDKIQDCSYLVPVSDLKEVSYRKNLHFPKKYQFCWWFGSFLGVCIQMQI